MRRVKKGEIYQFEFGKNFVPEMSYEHRGLIIGVNKKLLYVLPIFSYDPKKHLDVYHRLENPESKSAFQNSHMYIICFSHTFDDKLSLFS